MLTDALTYDVRHAIRFVAKQRAVAAVVFVTLALGISANTAIFSLVDAVLLRPLPYPHADRIVSLWERRPTGQRNAMSTLNYLDYAQAASIFESVAATTGCCGDVTLGEGTAPLLLGPARVSPAYFDILGIPAALGRTLRPGDDVPGRDRVVVISHTLWVSRFGSDPTLVGRSIRLDSEPYTVVGVMPANSPFDRRSIWLPLTFGPERMTRGSHWLLTVTGGALARLRPDVTIDQARAELNTLAARIARDHPDTNKDWGVVVEPYASAVVGADLRQSLYLLFAAVGAVLLIACVNLANVMLARGLEREREIAVRLALGATRGRLMQQFLVESLVLSGAAGVAGLAVGFVAAGALYALITNLPINPALPPLLMPPEAVVALDRRVLLFTLAISLGCGIAFGLAPAIAVIRATRLDAGLARRAASTVGHQRVRRGLIVAEVALACVLLTAAGLLARSFVNLQRAETGFDGTNVLTARLPLREHRYANAEELRAFTGAVIARVASLPGVRDVAISDGRPMQGSPTGEFIEIEGHPIADRALRPVVNFKVVTPGYFRALRLGVRPGRALSDLDRDGTPLVVVINESMARRFFPNQNPVGRHVLMSHRDVSLTQAGGRIVPWEVVGVMVDERQTPFADKRDQSAVYVAFDQSPTTWVNIIVRTSLEPRRIEPALRQAITAVDRDQVVADVRTVNELKSDAMLADQLRSALVGLLAGVALLLSSIGIYGVITQMVVQRRHELGIRAALGASAVRLMVLVLRDGMALTVIGIAAGMAASRGTGRLVATFLYGVSGTDWGVSLVSVCTLTLVATIACYVPAREATQIDPVAALRSE
jgi:putative ABC transport system permease protein